MRILNFIAERRNKILVGTLAALIAGFLALSLFVAFMPLTFVDLHISQEIQEHQNAIFDQFMKLISWFGNIPVSLVLVFSTSALFLLSGYKREACYLLITLGSGMVSSVLKLLVNRPRPAKDFVTIVEEAQQQSFPSGHTMFYVIFFGFLIIVMFNLTSIPKLIRITTSSLSVAMIFLVPISRIYLGAHWFTDVLGGFMGGVMCLFLLSYYYLRASDKKA